MMDQPKKTSIKTKNEGKQNLCLTKCSP